MDGGPDDGLTDWCLRARRTWTVDAGLDGDGDGLDGDAAAADGLF